MGKRKIEIEKIENNNKRMIAFSKRRQGLFKKAADVCSLCDAQVAIIVFSAAGKLYSFGHSSVDSVIHQFLTGKEKEREIKSKYNTNLHHRMTSSDGFWWDNIDMEELDSVEKLQDVYNAMLNLKQNVSKRLEKLTSSSTSSASSYSAAAAAAAAAAGSSTSTATITTAEDDDSSLLRGDNYYRWL